MKYYVVNRYCKREDTNPGIWGPGWIGYLPVYGTREYAEKFAEGRFAIWEIELRKAEPQKRRLISNALDPR